MNGNSRKVIAFLGVGSNIGDAGGNCLDAIGHLSRTDGIKLLRRSSLYRTEPVGLKEQAWFVNCAVEIRTGLSPRALFEVAKRIESAMGRASGVKWGPRIIDLDILLYGQEVIEEEGLLIPHPEMHRRRFVLEPLHEIAPYAIHPVYGISIKGLLDRLEDGNAVSRMPEPAG